MNAWVFRNLDELRRIYAGDSCVLDREEPGGTAAEDAALRGPFPGAVERHETQDGHDVILTPGKRRKKPDR